MSIGRKTLRLIKRGTYVILTAAALGFTWGFAEAVTNRYWPVIGVYRNHDFLSSLNDRAFFYASASLLLLVFFLLAFYAFSKVLRLSTTWKAAFRAGIFWVVFIALALNLFWLYKSGAVTRLFTETVFDKLNVYLNHNIALFFISFYVSGLVVWTGFTFLRFGTRSARVFRFYLVLALLGFFGCRIIEPAINNSRPVPGALPDVYVITVDACRADFFTPENAPKLTRYAEENCVIFTKARSPSTWTTPSFAAFFAGLPPAVCLSDRLVFGTGQPTIAEILYDNGYDTHLITGNPILDKYRGLHRGFDDHKYWTYSPFLNFLRFYDTNMYNSFTREFRITTPAGVVNKNVTEKTLSAIKNEGRRPKFVWVHYMDPHWPYHPLAEYVDDKYVEYAEDERFCTRARRHRKLKYNRINKELYSAEIRMLDNDISVLLDAIGGRGDPLIIFTSDHGEEFYEHGRRSHGLSYYEEVVRVPCFIRFPEAYTAVKSPSIVYENVNLVSLAPTILSILGLEIPADMVKGPFVGENTLPSSSDTLFFGTRLRPRKYLYMAVRGDKKIVLEADDLTGGGEYFDLYLDPYEKNPLPFDETAEEMRVALVAWVKETEKARDSLRLPPGTPDDSDLRALGYVK